MDEAPIIGIDLGTTYSCAAVYANERAEIVPMKNGQRTMASCVSYASNCRLIGDDAKENSVTDPTTTIFGVKRYIGRRFNDPVLQNSINSYPYEIINVNNSPKIKVLFKGEEKCFSPEEISAVILGKIKENAEFYFKKNVTKAIVTVPAHFNDSQRQATKDAGRIAGLEIVRIINEPTAAALAYGIHEKYKNNKEPCNILIFDFGGGTFDVSVIAADDGIFEVKSTNGDTHLGGDDIDQRLIDHFVKEFKIKFNLNLNSDCRAIKRLRMQCEKLKRSLSTFPESSIDLDALCNGYDFYSGITRSEFELLCSDLFERTLQLLQQALTDANVTKDSIDEVVLVGGTTRIPKVQQMVQRFFNNKKLNLSLNPDEAVAIGAAVQAAILDGNKYNSALIGSLLLIDVNSLSLGVATMGSVMSVIIPRNTTIPVEIQKQYETASDNQTTIEIDVYEGERRTVKENILLGSFTLKGLKPAPRGSIKIIVTFLLNTDGILYVSATEKKGTTSKSLNIEMNKNRLSEEDILKMTNEAKRYQREDEKWEATVRARIKLENYCSDTKKRATEEFSQSITEEHKQIILLKCDETQKWSQKNQNQSKEDYERKLKDVYNVCNPVIKLYL